MSVISSFSHAVDQAKAVYQQDGLRKAVAAFADVLWNGKSVSVSESKGSYFSDTPRAESESGESVRARDIKKETPKSILKKTAGASASPLETKRTVDDATDHRQARDSD